MYETIIYWLAKSELAAVSMGCFLLSGAIFSEAFDEKKYDDKKAKETIGKIFFVIGMAALIVSELM